MAESEKVYRRFPELYFEEIDGEIFIVDDIPRRIHSLGPAGSAVWRILDQPRTRQDCLEFFYQAFPDDDKITIEGLVDKAIKDMEQKGIIFG